MATEVGTPTGAPLTRVILISGACLAAASSWLIVARKPEVAAATATASAVLLLLGGHRANHGAGWPWDRMLDSLLDRLWDGLVLGAIAWVSWDTDPATAIGALVTLGGSFVSSYIRARAAALHYTVEESHVTRGLRYSLIVIGLATGWLNWTIWVAAVFVLLSAVVRTTQVTKEERV